MEEIITKEIAEKLMERKGELRGAVFRADVGFILRERGKEGLEKIENEMKKLGYPFKYEKIRTMDFYPIGLRAVSLLVIKKVLGFSDEKIKEMGAEVPKSSFIMRLSLKFFSFAKNPEFWYRNATKLWKRFLTVGELSVPEFDEEKKRVIVRIKNFNVHPVFCTYMLGILKTFHELARAAKNVTCQETKCPFKGSDYHEFLNTW